MINLDDEQAIDYSANDVQLLPFESYGTYDLAIVNYVELVDEDEKERRIAQGVPEDAIREAFNGSCDIATVEVLESNNDDIRVGSIYGLYFDTHAKGKAKPFAAARLRQFVAAAVGASAKDPAFRAKDARDALLSTDLSEGGARVRLVRRERVVKKGDYAGQSFANDFFSSLGE